MDIMLHSYRLTNNNGTYNDLNELMGDSCDKSFNYKFEK